MAFVRYVTTNMQYLAGAGAAVLIFGSEYPNTLGLNKYRRVFAHYVDGKEQPLDPAIADLAEKVTFAFDMAPKEQVELQFFTAFGHNTCHKGSIKLRSGALVGLPATLSYTSVDQVPRDDLLVNNQTVAWDSDAGQRLIHSLVLSPEAKSFAIAREISYVNTNPIHAQVFLKGGFFLLAYATGFSANNLLQLRSRMKRWGRMGLYGLIGCTYYSLYCTVADTYFCYRDDKVDYKTSKLGQLYAEGGVEFYNKILERNTALRSLMGKEGQKIYTHYGNENATLRRPHVQLTVRRDNLLKYVKEYHQKNTDGAEDSGTQFVE